tara:strand:+ start:8604 stop:10100 length:1497 start_codon:yes stop_codon:yes gene_type:complete
LGDDGKGYNRIGTVACSAVAVPVLFAVSLLPTIFAAAPAHAGDWSISPAIGTTGTFSDNANGATDREDRNSDQLFTVSPAINVRGSGGRVSLNLAYSHNRFYSRQDTAQGSSTNNLSANGQAEIWERSAFVNVTSSITRQVVDPAESVSTTDTGSDANRTTVRTVSIQPFFLHHFGNWLETESRTSFNFTQSESDEITNTESLGETFTVNSGNRFTLFTFGGSLNRQKEIRANGEPRSISTTLNTNYRYQVSRKLSLISSVGWETIDDPALSEEPNGIIWEVGFSAQPSSRSSLEFTVGDRFETTTYGLSASYRLSVRSNVSASYNESITTSQEQLNEDLSFIGTDANGQQIDLRTLQPFDASASELGFQTSLFRQKVLSVDFNTTRRRGSYSAGFNWERRTTDSTGVLERVLGMNLSASRTLSSRLSTSVSTALRFIDRGTPDQREDITHSLTGSLTYRLMENTNAALSYARSQTRSTEGSNNFRDNTVTINLTRNF